MTQLLARADNPQAARLELMYFTFGPDEIDAIAGKRESAQREMERRIVAQMLTCMDDLAAPRSTPSDADCKDAEDSSTSLVGKHVLVIGKSSFTGCSEEGAVDDC